MRGLIQNGDSSGHTVAKEAVDAAGTEPGVFDGTGQTYGAGGGAGGSVFLIAEEVDLAADSIDAQGGWGEDTHTRVGGDGGDGRVRIDCNSCNGFSHGSSDANDALDDAAEPDPGYSGTPS